MIHKIGLLFFLIQTAFTGLIEAKNTIDSSQIYHQFDNEIISLSEIDQWLEQFDEEDREAALMLLSQIDYFSYKRLMKDLCPLHQKLLFKLVQDGFIEHMENEMEFQKVDFSKTFCAKSGDLMSYFYRNANKIRAVSFKNIGDLKEDTSDKSNKALVIVDDYVGTGVQFLFVNYAKSHHALFNEYKKIYFVVLVANIDAINRFEKIKSGDSLSFANDIIGFLNIQDKDEQLRTIEIAKRIPKEKLEIIYLHEETFLTSTKDPQIVKQIMSVLDKYNLVRYLGGNFSTFGHTVFFYSCPNNMPEILWNSRSLKRDGSPWIPLFKRVEDLSIYDISKNIPIEKQIW